MLFLRLGHDYIRAEGDPAFEEWAVKEWLGLQRRALEVWVRQTQAELNRGRAALRKIKRVGAIRAMKSPEQPS